MLHVDAFAKPCQVLFLLSVLVVGRLDVHDVQFRAARIPLHTQTLSVWYVLYEYVLRIPVECLQLQCAEPCELLSALSVLVSPDYYLHSMTLHLKRP